MDGKRLVWMAPRDADYGLVTTEGAKKKVIGFIDLYCPNEQPKAKSSKKPAPPPFGASKSTKVVKNPLFEAHPKNFGIGMFCSLKKNRYS